MLYPELFRQLEAVRWNMDTDIPWGRFDPGLLSNDQAQTVKMNAITEWAALPATEMFLRDNRDDSDFSAFMSVWFFEEQKHSLVLMEYLRRFRPELVPTEEELHEVRFEFDPAWWAIKTFRRLGWVKVRHERPKFVVPRAMPSRIVASRPVASQS